MSNEQMTYKMQPAGHEEPAPKRNYGKPDSKLASEFEKWMTEFSRTAASYYGQIDDDFPLYRSAEKAIQKLEISADQVHGLLLQYQDHPLINLSGFFISALYNKVPEKIIVIDTKLNHPDCYLGYKLAKDKTLVNLSELESEMFGYYAEGTLVNLGKIGDRFGSSSLGPLLNYGIAGDYFGVSAGKGEYRETIEGPVLNFGETGNCLGRAARCPVINFGKTGERLGSENWTLVVNCGEAGDKMAWAATGKILPIKRPNGRVEGGKGTIVYDNELFPKLGIYFEQMRAKFEKGRNDYKLALQALEKLGENPGEKVIQDIEAILKRANYGI